MSARDRNPFTPGNGIVPPLVAGRGQVLESFRSILGENARGLPRNMILYGLRGIYEHHQDSISWSGRGGLGRGGPLQGH